MRVAAQHANPRETQLALALQRLLAIDPAAKLEHTLVEAASLIAEALGADRVDVLTYEVASDSLVALAAPDLQRGRRRLGAAASRYALHAGGLPVEVFCTGAAALMRSPDRERGERRHYAGARGIRSELLCQFKVHGTARGVLHAMSSRPNAFMEADLRFLEAAARWMGLVIQSVEALDRTSGGEAKAMLGTGAGAMLTEREWEVAVLVASGLTNKEIAGELVLVPGTVSNHVLHILRKLGFTRRAQIATWVTQQGFRFPARAPSLRRPGSRGELPRPL